MSPDQLSANGFTVMRGCLPQRLFDGCVEALVKFISEEADRCGGVIAEKIHALAYDRIPHDGLIILRDHDAEAMRQVVDRMKISSQFFSLIYAPEVIRLAKEIMELEVEADVLMAHPNFRADLPHKFKEEERKFSLPWHQEGAYYKVKASPRKSLVMHMSLFDCTSNHGALELKKGSHCSRYVSHDEYFMDEQAKKHFRVEISEDQLGDFETVPLVTEVGDLAVIDFRTFHRSGVNISDDVRYTFLIRVSPANAADLVV